jgi:dihydroorotase
MYKEKGSFIKFNPSAKTPEDRAQLIKALDTGKINIVSTDHAPHILEEKSTDYLHAPSGAPMVQHSLTAMLQLWKNGFIRLETIAKLMAHNPAKIFKIYKRGYIRPGYSADITVIDPDRAFTVSKDTILYKCGWSPLEGEKFDTSVFMTIVNGCVVYKEGKLYDCNTAMPVKFER